MNYQILWHKDAVQDLKKLTEKLHYQSLVKLKNI